MSAIWRLLVIAIVVMVLFSAPAHAQSINHTPDSDVLFDQVGDSYSFTVDTTGTSKLTDFSVDLYATEPGTALSFPGFEIFVNGESAGTYQTTGVFDGTEQVTLSGDLGQPISTDTTTIEIVWVDDDDNVAEVEWRSGDEIQINGVEPVTLTNLQSTSTETSPTELSVDVSNVTTSTDVVFRDADGAKIATKTISSNQTVSTAYNWTRSDIENEEIKWSVEATGLSKNSSFEPKIYGPEISNPAPDGVDVFETPVKLSVDVSDPDIGTIGDELNVTFYDGNGGVIGSKTTTSNTTIQVDYQTPRTGRNEWYATVEDVSGATASTDVNVFNTPAELQLRNESAPNELVTNSGEVEVRFFADESGEVITRSTSDGKISMDGLPANEPLVASVNVDGYYARTIAIDSILEQQRLFMLPENEDVSQVDWVLNDESGQFEATETTLFIERPLEINGTTEYRVVVGERFGGTGRFASQLRTDDRYRLRIVNSDGDSRVLGSYTAAGAAQETLTIGSIGFPGVNDSGAAFSANINDDDAVLEYKYVDERSATDNLNVEIRRDNQTIYSAETVGPIRTARERVPLSTLNHSEGDSYTVAYEADRGGSTIAGDRVVGDIRDIAQDWSIDSRILDALGYLTVIALFGATVILSPRHAGIVGSSVAMALSLIGVIAVNQILIGFALVVSSLFAVGGGR